MDSELPKTFLSALVVGDAHEYPALILSLASRDTLDFELHSRTFRKQPIVRARFAPPSTALRPAPAFGIPCSGAPTFPPRARSRQAYRRRLRPAHPRAGKVPMGRRRGDAGGGGGGVCVCVHSIATFDRDLAAER
jgi:hypothetical protein